MLVAALSAWHGPPDWTAYAEFNLGVALVRKGRLPDAIPHLDQVGRMETSSEELLALRDKANLALGFDLPAAVNRGKEFITNAIAQSRRAAGHSILNHNS